MKLRVLCEVLDDEISLFIVEDLDDGYKDLCVVDEPRQVFKKKVDDIRIENCPVTGMYIKDEDTLWIAIDTRFHRDRQARRMFYEGKSKLD